MKTIVVVNNYRSPKKLSKVLGATKGKKLRKLKKQRKSYTRH